MILPTMPRTISTALDALGVQENLRPALLEQIRRKSAHGLRQECARIGLADASDLCALLEMSGPVEDIITRAGKLVKNDRMAQTLEELVGLCRQLPPETEIITLDLSLAGDMEYYNGLVFQGYLSGLSSPVLKGGRYDLLARKFNPGISAVGFALYLDDLDRLEACLNRS